MVATDQPDCDCEHAHTSPVGVKRFTESGWRKATAYGNAILCKKKLLAPSCANIGDFVRTIQGAITLLAGKTAQEREEGKPKRCRRHWVRPHIMAHEDHGVHAQLMSVL